MQFKLVTRKYQYQPYFDVFNSWTLLMPATDAQGKIIVRLLENKAAQRLKLCYILRFDVCTSLEKLKEISQFIYFILY